MNFFTGGCTNGGRCTIHTHIVIQEVDEENWGYAGLLTDDWRKQQ